MNKILIWKPCVFSYLYIFIQSDLFKFSYICRYIYIYIYIYMCVCVCIYTGGAENSSAQQRREWPRAMKYTF